MHLQLRDIDFTSAQKKVKCNAPSTLKYFQLLFQLDTFDNTHTPLSIEDDPFNKHLLIIFQLKAFLITRFRLNLSIGIFSIAPAGVLEECSAGVKSNISLALHISSLQGFAHRKM